MDETSRTIVEMLDTIPKFDTYSQYSSSLEKVFKDYSFKHLLKNLREPKKPEIYSFFNVEEKVKDTSNIFKQNKINPKKDEFKNSLLNDTDDTLTKQNNEKENCFTQKIITKPPVTSIKKRYNPQLDPFRYNPNYKSIFKNTPCVRIARPLKETDKDMVRKPIESPFLTEIGSKTMTTTNSPYISRIKKLDINSSKTSENLNYKKKLKKIKTEESDNKNNHSIRFDKYVERKENISEVNPNVSYIEPFDYKKIRNNSIDFNKMRSREDKFFYNMNNFKGPSIGYYEPNYTCLDKNLRNISLGKIKKEKNRKFLLKKLWGSYHVQADYQLIDNKKLRNTLTTENNM